MTKRQVEKRLQAARDRFTAEIQSIADDVHREVIIPACKRTGGDFISGMGAYPFYDKDGHPFETWDAPAWIRKIYELLDSEVYGDEPLGYWVDSYRQE